MCDCFHVVLPSWAGAPGSAAGRRLQPEDLDLETENSVTEGPGAEIIRPRPQGSSPVYECTEGVGVGLLEDERGSRRAWRKRDSGDSRTFSRMSRTEVGEGAEATTLKTEVEAGASGYSVAGGGRHGLFVKQVLKGSTAAKLFSLQEGDQLLSATIFFDDIRYEDALKILQYSEPYKVQFCIRRKLPEAQQACQQEQDVTTEGLLDTPTKTLEGEGDQERLLSKTRTGRGRKAQRERLSWPKFQAIKSKGRPGPRRSHSSSEAYEQGADGDVSPTSTDTEAQLPDDAQEMKAGSKGRRRKGLINLRFRKLSGKAGCAGWQRARGAQGGEEHAGLQGEAEAWSDAQEESMTGVAEETRQKAAAPKGRLSTEQRAESAQMTQGDNRKATEKKHRREGWEQHEPHLGKEDPMGTRKGDRRPRGAGQSEPKDVLELEQELARLSLKDKTQETSSGTVLWGTPVRFPKLKTPKFRVKAEDREETRTKREKPDQEENYLEKTKQEGREKETNVKENKDGDDIALGGKDVGARDSKFKMPRFKMPSFGGSAAGKASVHSDVDVTLPEMQPDVSLPSAQGELKTGDLSVQLPSLDVDVASGVKAVQLPDVEVPEATLPDVDVRGGLKSHLPKMKTPSFKVPKVDFKGPQVDITAPKLDVKGAKADVSTPSVEVKLPTVDVDIRTPEATLEADIALGGKDVGARDSKFKMPKFKMPSFGGSAAGKSIEASMHSDVDVTLPEMQADVSLPSAQGELKTGDLSVQLPSLHVDVASGVKAVQPPDVEVPEATLPDVDVRGGLKGHLPKVKTPSFKVPKVDFKGPQVDITAPKLDVKGAKADVSTPSVEVKLPTVDVDIRTPEATLEADIALGGKDVGARDSKFKMPKFKMPSFGGSAAGKSIEASMHSDVDVTLPEMQPDVSLPSAKGELKTGDLSVQLPSLDVDVASGVKAVQPPDVEVPEATLPDVDVRGGLKGHLPKVKTPSFKVPKVDFKGPQVDITAPKLDVKGAKADVSTPSVEVKLPTVDVDIRTPEATLEADIALGGKDVGARDSKFKMPKFKMPSFGGSAAGKSIEASMHSDVDVTLPEMQADVSLSSAKGELKTRDLSVQLPSVDVDVVSGVKAMQPPDVEMPEATLPDVDVRGSLKGHLPKVKTPSFKVPKVDFKGPQVDITAPKLDVKGAKADVSTPSAEVKLPTVEVDIRTPEATLEADIALGGKDVGARDSKFKMPKFKMPSFGGSAAGKSIEASMHSDVDVTLPEMQADVSLSSAKGELKTGDLSVQLPSLDVDVPSGVKAVQLPDVEVPEATLPDVDVRGGLKSHLPKMKTPSFKVPKVDFKGPQVDITAPKLDVKGAKADVTTPSVEVKLPTVDVDIRTPEATLEADIALGGKDVGARDSKFQMPKFKMPSFGGSAAGKSIEASMHSDVDVTLPEMQADVSLPSAQGELKTGDLSVQLPSMDVDVASGVKAVQLPDVEVPEATLPDVDVRGGLKSHLPKMKTPSFKVPKVDFKGPQVDITAPKLDVKGAKADVSTPSVEVKLPTVDVDIRTPEATLEADIALGGKDVGARDSKFKMPKFKMPSFGGSAAGKSIEASMHSDVDVTLPEMQPDVSLPSAKGELKTGDLSVQLPSLDVDVASGVKAVQPPDVEVPEATLPDVDVRGGLKGHLPKVKTPSFKVPKVDFKGPQVDITAPKLDVKGAKADVSTPSVEVKLPTVDVDIRTPEATLEADIALGGKDVGARDSKFKMPKFKMPSFGGSAAGKASVHSDVDVTLPEMQPDVSLPSAQGELKTGDLSVQLPSLDVDVASGVKAVQPPDVEVPEATLPDEDVRGGLKGHLPKVKTPSFKVPKVDFKGPQVDITAPKLDVKGAKADVSTPSVEVKLPTVDVDIRTPEATLEADIALGGKDVGARDSKFKMPKFKMPSFGGSTAGKSIEASMHSDVDVTLPEMQPDVSLPSAKGELKTGDLSVQLPSLDVDVASGVKAVQPPDVEVPEATLPDVDVRGGLKGHLPKVKTPSFKVPKVDFKGPQVDITAPKLDVKGAKADVSTPSVEVKLPTVDVDIRTPEATLEADIALGGKDVGARDSKFKMPKFTMPSFGGSAAGKASVHSDVDVTLPEMQPDVSLPSAQGELKTGDLSVQLPSLDVDVASGVKAVQPPDVEVPEATLPDVDVRGGLKGHLPKVKTPSFKVPKVDFKGPQVDITAPKLDVKGAKADVSTPSVEVKLPTVDVDIRTPEATLEADIALGGKDVGARDSKFKMPKFKMPSFGGSAAGKSIEASMHSDVDVTLPEMQADVSLSSAKGELKTRDLSVQLPSVDVDVVSGVKAMQPPDFEMPEATLPDVDVRGSLKGHLPKVKTPSFKVPKVDFKGPQVDITAPKLDVKGAKADVSTPSAEVKLPTVEVDIRTPEATLEADIALGGKDVGARDSKFKMPKFKMPSFGGSAAGKSIEASMHSDVDVTLPEMQADVSLSSAKGELKTGDLSVQLPSLDVDVPSGVKAVQLPDVEVPEATLPDVDVRGGLKSHLPKMKTPSFKVPKVDFKGPQVDITAPKLDVKGAKADVTTPSVEVKLPTVDVDIRTPEATLEADIALGGKDVGARDSKFQMPKFKMPSFGGSAAGKASVHSDVDVTLPEMQADVSLPSAQGELKTGDLSVQLPSMDVDVASGVKAVQLPDVEVPEATLPDVDVRGGLKSHLPKMKTPSFKVPKVDFKGPQVDITAPKLDVKGAKADVSTPSVEVKLPTVDVDIRTPEATLEADIALGGKDVGARDSKFKMPKFKMPSFGGSAAGKSIEASMHSDVDVTLPEMQPDVSLPSAQGELKTGDLSVQLPSLDVDVASGVKAVQPPDVEVPEATLPDVDVRGGLKGHLPKVKTPSFKVPKVDFKGPQVDITAPKLDVKGAKADVSTPSVEVKLPTVDVDIRTPEATLEADIALGGKDVGARDSKFKMPKFKMPSFGGSAAGKSIEASMHSDVDVTLPEMQPDVSLPSAKGELKTGDLSIQLPSLDVDVASGVKAVQPPDVEVPEATLPDVDVRGGLKGHLPKVKTPSFKVPKVDFKGPQVDITAPKLDVKGAKADVSTPSVEVKLPTVDVDIRTPEATLEADIALGGKDVGARDSKFKMPKITMPSFGGSAAGKASVHSDVDVTLPEMQPDVSLPSAQGELKTGDLSVQLPSLDVDVASGVKAVQPPDVEVPEATLPDVDVRGGLKGHLPKVKTPSFKVPKVDFKGPQVDITAPKLDVKGAKADVSTPSVEVKLPTVDVDIRTPEATLEADIALGGKDVGARDSKFKMPKFKMPSFGGSAAGKSIEASMHSDVDVTLPEMQADVSLSSAKGELKTRDLSVQLPSVDVDVVSGVKAMQPPDVEMPEATLPDVDVRGGLKGHLPKVKTPSFKVPKVDFKGPQVDITAPKLDVKGAKADVSTPSVEVKLPTVDVDIRTPEATLEADIALGGKDVGARDSKFKMPKFKMPSFGGSAAGKSIEASMHSDVDVTLPEMQADVSLSSAKGELKTGDLSVQLPSLDVDVPSGVKAVQLPDVEVPEATLPDVDVRGGLKSHLPKMKTPSFKVPKVDFKGPQVDITAPKLDVKGAKADVTTPSVEVKLPTVDVDIQTPEATLEADIALGGKDVGARDSKFQMPKFKMPSFGGSAAGKASVHSDVDVTLPEMQADVSLPSAQGELRTGELSVQLPSVDVDVPSGVKAVQLTDVEVPEATLPDVDVRGGLKSHLPKMKTPSFKVPKVDFKGPQVDITAPKLDVKGAKADVTTPSVEVKLPTVDVDIRTPEAPLEADIALGGKDVGARDSKFQMPKFKMPSFGGSAAGKSSVHSDVDVTLPEMQADVSLPSAQGELMTGELSVQLPSVDVDVTSGVKAVELPDVEVPEATLPDVDVRGGLKSHLPKMKTPSFKVPKVDFKGPQVDITAPKLDVKGAKADVTTPSVEVKLPTVDVDIQTPEATLDADIALGGKDVGARDSKFQMPKFKMPSFGGSAAGKASVHSDVDVTLPEMQADVSLPSAQGELKTGELSVQLPSVDVDVPSGVKAVELPDVEVPEATLPDVDVRGGLKSHLPKMKTPSFKVPKVDFKGPQVDITAPKLDVKGAKSDVTTPSVEVKLPTVDVDIQTPEATLEADIALGGKDVGAKDSKFKMPKFKMPSFGGSAAGKSIEASMHSDVDVTLPEMQADVSLPSAQGELKTGELSVQLPSVDVDVASGVKAVQLPDVEVPEATLPDVDVRGGLKSHLPKMKTPSFKVPKVDFKGPQVDITAPKLDVKGAKADVTTPSVEVKLPTVDVDIRTPEATLEADIALGGKDVGARDSKFQMPKFKMPSFGGTAAGKASVHSDVDVTLPEMQADVSLPSAQGELKTGELSVQLPSVDVDVPSGVKAVQLPDVEVPEATLPDVDVRGGLKSHLPKMKTPSFKVPKVDFKGPQVDITAPKLDVKGAKADVSTPSVEVKLPTVDVDIRTPEATLEADIALGGKDVGARDSKFKMPKFKMPSFGGSAAGKSIEASMHSDVDVTLPEMQAVVSLPSAQGELKTGDLSVQLPSLHVDVASGVKAVQPPDVEVPEATLPDVDIRGGLKSHLPKMKTPSFKVPKVDFKGPQVDITAPKLDVKGAKADVSTPSVEVKLPTVDVDIRTPEATLEADIALGGKDVGARDSKFKMPKFKMPSFGGSAAGKSIEASMHSDVDVTLPEMQADVSLPSAQGELQTGELSVQLPSVDVDVPSGVKAVQLPDVEVPEATLPDVDIRGGLKSHLPKMKTPSFKVPKVDFKGPQVDITAPKLDVKGAKADVSTPSVEVKLPTVDVDIRTPEATLEADIALGGKDVGARDSKFQMPKFKMTSFVGSAAGKASVHSDVDVTSPEMQADVSLPSAQLELKTGELSVQLPSVDVDVPSGVKAVQLPDVEVPEATLPDVDVRGGLKSHLPKMKTPSFKVPKVDFKGPQVDITAPKLDVKGAKADVSTPSVEVKLPTVDVDIRTPEATLEADIALGGKDVGARDSKFKMPKFKMPSFGGSAAGKASVHSDVDVTLPEMQADVSLPSAQGELKTGDLSVQLPSLDVDVASGVKAVQPPDVEVPEATLPDVDVRGGLKGHLPKVKTPSFKVPKVDFKGPQVDITAPKLDVKGAKADVSTPSVEVKLPTVDVDIRTPEATLEADIALGGKDVGARDSKFKMPKFKMPSFGGSAAGKSIEASMHSDVDVTLPEMQADVSLSSAKGELKTGDLSVQLPSVDVDVVSGVKAMQPPDVEMPETTLPDVDVRGGLKGHLPKVKTPSFKVPKVDFKGPQVDITAPKLDVKGAKADVSTPSAEVKLPTVEVDIRTPEATLEADIALGVKAVGSKDRKFKMPKFKMPSFRGSSPSKSVNDSVCGDLDVAVGPSPQGLALGGVSIPSSAVSLQLQSDPSFSVSSGPGTLIKFQEDIPQVAESHVLLVDTSEGVMDGVSKAILEGPLPSPVACHTESIVSLFPTSYGPVTFPKFHGPKFQYSDPTAMGTDSVCMSPEVPSQTEGTSSAVACEVPTEGAARAGKGSPLKMPKLKLPSFRWSPKKGVPKHHVEDVKLSASTETDRLQGMPQVYIHPKDVPPEEDGEGIKLGQTGPVLPELPLPTTELSQARAVLSPGEPHPTFSRTLVVQSGIKDPDTTEQHSLSLGDSACAEVSKRQPIGKPVIPTTENPLLPSCRPKDADVSSTEGAASRDSWFRMPTFHLPGMRRASSKEKGEAAGLEKVPRLLLDTCSPQEEAPGRAMTQELLGEVAVPLHSPKSNEDKAFPDSASYADVLRRNLHSTGPGSGKQPLPAGSSSPVGTCPAEGPLLLTHASFSEIPGPEAEAVRRPSTVMAPSPHGPAPTSLGGMGIVWEDSVLKVRFPKLKVPRFTFPDPSLDTDIFIPMVREVWHPENHLHLTLQTENPEIWGATILKESAGHCREQLKDCHLPSEVPPISKVRVRIQGAQAESHAVTIHSRALAGSADPWGPKTFTTETVCELETPASQKASYGFSPLKGRNPEPTLQTGVSLGAHETPREVVLSADSQEPFEVVSSDREATAGFEVGSGAQCAESCSDEEPAEILEFPPEDSPGATLAEHIPPKEKPESKRSSGLFRFWFPNIGFSPSAPEEPVAASGAQIQQTGPVQKQPEARPESRLPGKQEKAGWFRFPKLGFSSPPAEKCQATEDEASLAEHNLQDEAATFFDARETFSPGEEEEEELTHDAHTAASSARTK
ncbi:protein AHNAK2 [Sorex fumeus]|uniref:protein AHNAK2 n=1 Tax=Sorex fumeus TaxID=62283 RepID=UPI0024ADDBE4|nr:protein AHNAK2 [Sorex fumeus]